MAEIEPVTYYAPSSEAMQSARYMTVDGVEYPYNLTEIRRMLMDAGMPLEKQMEVVGTMAYKCVDVDFAAELDGYLQQLFGAIERRDSSRQKVEQLKKTRTRKSQLNQFRAVREGKGAEITEYPRAVLKMGVPTAGMMDEAERLARGALDRGLFRYDNTPREIATMLGFHPVEPPLTHRLVWQQEPWKLAVFVKQVYEKMGGAETFKSFRNLCYVVHEAVEIVGTTISEETLRTARPPKGLTGDPFSGLFR